MRIDVLTIFPSMLEPVLNESIIKRARSAGKVDIRLHNIRDYTLDKHRKVDDRPYGGGCGMVMMPEPIFSCAEAVLKKAKGPKNGRRILLLSARGRKLVQKDFQAFSSYKHLLLICGHYEGVDERVARDLADEEVSVGDFVLTGGEIPAMLVIDATVRLIPGVLGNDDSVKSESFQDGLLEYPQYTRPAEFRGKKTPKVLLGGDHAKIEAWRKKEAVKITKKIRPDIIIGHKQAP
ncbi:MAG TPA: tRNA (guanosine(37)-N1)-methyltransferase TrmD [Candidatus Omnitrophica bacterium]|nr:tRNA (guanosine(37)-N1)-methyltransferase TrmD [Candidatus Omnitrophota bacterium]